MNFCIAGNFHGVHFSLMVYLQILRSKFHACATDQTCPIFHSYHEVGSKLSVTLLVDLNCSPLLHKVPHGPDQHYRKGQRSVVVGRSLCFADSKLKVHVASLDISPATAAARSSAMSV